MKQNMIIGTRQSLLALWQSNYIADCLRAKYTSCQVDLHKFVTKGDKILDVPLAKIGGKGLFTKELELALLEGKIDLAVHSLKDMPTQLPEGLTLAVITERANPQDALVSNTYTSFAQLPQGAVVGSSSLRRKAQLLAARPDLVIKDLRGNVDTRLRKLDDGEYDAIILAAAGLMRLGYEDRIKEILPMEVCLPAVGQGALAIECRADDVETLEMLAFLNDVPTAQATSGERAFLGLVEGGCQVPMGVHGIVTDGIIELQGVIASLDGKRVLKDSITGSAENSVELGKTLGKQMLAAGGEDILADIL